MKNRSRLDISKIAMFLIASIFVFIAGSFIATRTARAQKSYTVVLQEVPASAPEYPPTSADEPAETPPPEVAQARAPKEKLPVIVTNVFRAGNPGDGSTLSAVGVGDNIEFRVENLRQLISDSLCQEIDGTPVPNCTPKKIRVFLDGVMLPGIDADSLEPDQGAVRFHLQRNRATNFEQWKKLLSPPSAMSQFFSRPVNASVGLDDGVQYHAGVPIRLVRVEQWKFWLWLAAIVALAVGLILLARYTSLLRDPEAPEPGEGKFKPYSLGRCQAAFWFFLVISAFCFIFIIMGALDSLTEGVLGLLGISSATTVGAALINRRTKDANENTLKEAEAERDAAAVEMKQLSFEHEAVQADMARARAAQTEFTEAGGTPEKAAGLFAQPIQAHAMRAQTLELQREIKSSRLTVLQDKAARMSSEINAPRASKGLRLDTLTDGKGNYGFHRLQLAAWMLVLGGIFIYTVWSSLSMPDYSAILVTLQAIGGATYLGLKIPENKV